MSDDGIEPDPEAAPAPRTTRIYVSPLRPIEDGLKISDYEGVAGTGPRVPGNAPAQGGSLPDPEDEGDDAEGALAAQHDARRLSGAEETLRRLAPQVDATPNPEDVAADEYGSSYRDAKPPEQRAAPAPRADAASEEQLAAANAFEAAARRISDAVISPAKGGDPAEKTDLVPIARDLARGTVEAPRQIVGGIRDAAQATIDFADWLTGIDKTQFETGGKTLDYKDVKRDLPEVKKPKTVTGGLVRGVSQFLAGFAGAGKVVAPLKLAGRIGTAGTAAVKGAVADFVAFDAHQQRLGNLIEKNPELKNPVTAYLASKPGDGEAEGRFKNAVEGLGLGVMAEGLIKAVRYVRDTQRAAGAAVPAKSKPMPRAAGNMDLLGDESAPLLVKGKGAPDEAGRLDAETLHGEALQGHGVPDDIMAKAVSHAPLSEGADAVYVNFARINSPDDVKAVIASTAEAFRADIEAARRGVRSNEVTMKAADGEDAWKALIDRRQGQPLNAEQSLAARRLWEASATKLLDVARAAEAAPSPENLFQFRRMLAIHNAVQAEVIAARTETARALQSWNIPAGGGGAERLRAIENVLASHGGDATAEQLAREVAALARMPGGLPALADIAEKGAMTRSIDVAKEVWVNALLSNPKTHVVNMLGNTAGLLSELVERAAAGVYSQAIGSGAISPREGAAKAFALRQGMQEGLRLAWKSARTGESQFGPETLKSEAGGFGKAISAEALHMSPDDWMGRGVDALGTVVNVPTRLLGAEDDFFKAIAYRMEVNAQAFRKASDELIDGRLAPEALNGRLVELMRNPPESVRLDAADYASYQTFTAAPGELVRALNTLERRFSGGSSGEQIAGLAMRMLIPFRNTPANLVKYGFERTPLAPLMNRYREAIAQGGAAADIARARMSLGTMSMLALMDLALDGNITGGGPRGDAHKGDLQTLYRAGWQPYSIKVGDRYYSYRRTDPFGLFMGTAADLADIIANSSIDEDKRDSVLSAAAMASASFGNLVLDKTYMSTLSATIDVLHNPDRAPTFFTQRFAAFSPAVLGEVRRQVDPYVRYSASFVEELRNRTPGLSEDLPQARDFWGRTRDYQSGLGKIYDALSPIASRRYNPEPIDREAIANDFNMAMPQWTFATGQGTTLALRNRPAMYARFLEIRGQEKPSTMGSGKPVELIIRKYGDKPLLPLLNDIVEGRAGALSEQYAAAGGGKSGGKDNMVTKIVADYTRAAKIKLLSEFEEAQAVVERKKAKRAASQ
jgi:hypothetical protein